MVNFELYSSEPKLKAFLTIDDLKMRASLLAYAKYKYNKDLVKAAKMRKTCLMIIAISK